MSRTKHHRGQKGQHCGHDYGGRYNCNKSYSCGYGKYGRHLAAKERRTVDREEVSRESAHYIIGNVGGLFYCDTASTMIVLWHHN